MEILYWIVGGTLICLIFIEASFLLYYGIFSKRLSRRTIPFSRNMPGARATVMVFGDSTAYGAGSEKPEYSIAGRLALDFPQTNVYNFAQNGIRAKTLVCILEQHATKHADLVIVHIGGIDIFSLTRPKKFNATFEHILILAKQIANDHVIVLCSTNLGSLPYFHYPLSVFYEWNTRRIHRIVHALIKKHHVAYIDLFEEKGEDQMLKDWRRYFAEDRIHPSGEGYALWYKKVSDIIKKHGWGIALDKS
jgi:lysophospholipase L1-like esterase